MASNKHALIRYRALDRCFKDLSGTYKLKDLIRICSEDIHAYEEERQGKSIPFKSVSKRTILYDIEFMKEEYPGFTAPIEHDRKDGYYYSDNSFEIFEARMSKTDLEQFRDALDILKRLSGKGRFKHIDTAVSRIESTYNIKRSKQVRAILQFEDSSNIEGQKWISKISPFIKNKEAIKLEYKPFDRDQYIRIVSPYFIKEYNKRWFLIGFDHQKTAVTTIGLDRVKALKNTLQPFQVDTGKKADEYLKDVIGITVPDGSQVEKVVFKAHGILRHYIRTKPLHDSQKEIEFNDKYGKFSISVHINYELKSRLFQHKENLEVISPQGLKDDMILIVNNLLDLYKIKTRK